MDEGIAYDDLSAEDKATYEETFGDEEYTPDHISSAALNNWLFNYDTIDKVLVNLMENGLKVAGGDKLGKTIVFAAGHDHAVLIKERFDQLYPNLSGDFSQVIDNRINYASDLIGRFKDAAKFPQVAVSVDMLDTGIDVPEILNLVFFKKVRSKAKFWQMIGRGTRLCKNLLGEGKDKEQFYIFDYCGNFEFFRENRNPVESKISPSTTERIFNTKAKLILALQDLRFAGDSYQDYRTGLVESVAAASKALPMENFAVREKRVYVEKYAQLESFSSLTEKDVRNLSEQIAPLIISTDPDDKAKAFDAAMYLLMLSVINGDEKPAARAIKRTITIGSKLAQKGAAIPQILAQKELIEQVQTSTFWDGVSILEIEKVRVNLRDLIKFLDDSGHKVYINLQDEILAVFEGGAVYDYETADEDYKNKVNQYVNKHKEHIAIYKLMNNIPLTQTDYRSLEQILWHELGSKEDYDKQFPDTALGELIRSITGLTQEAANQAFAEFLSKQNLTAPQSNYLKTIINYVVKNGLVKDNRELTEPPFTTVGRITEIFPLEDALRIMHVLESIKVNAVRVS